MKRVSIYVLAIVVGLSLSVGVAMATDVIMKAKISQTITKIDKNGNEYVRLIVSQERKLGGVSYTVGVPVMAFKSLVPAAKTFKAGDTLKAVCQEKIYNGRKSYNIRVFLK